VTGTSNHGISTRRRLPPERWSITHKFEIGGHEGYITASIYEDGAPGEIFLVMAKEGSTLSGLMDSFAIIVSILLQHGVPLEVLVQKFSHSRFEPSGPTGNPEIPEAKSLVDYVFRWLASKFFEPDQLEGLADLGASKGTAYDAPGRPRVTDLVALGRRQGSAKPATAGSSVAPVRRRLPANRPSVTHKFGIQGHEGYITVSRHDDDTPGEIFLSMAKEGSTIAGMMNSFAIMVSMALQWGISLESLVAKFAHVRFEPSGYTKNPEIPIAKSIIDYVFRWLASEFFDRESKAAVGVILRDPAPAVESVDTAEVAATGSKEHHGDPS
jgi:hypothetical protein